MFPFRHRRCHTGTRSGRRVKVFSVPFHLINSIRPSSCLGFAQDALGSAGQCANVFEKACAGLSTCNLAYIFANRLFSTRHKLAFVETLLYIRLFFGTPFSAASPGDFSINGGRFILVSNFLRDFCFSWLLASGFCGFWLLWLLAFAASVAFGFRGFRGFCGFWLSWLSWLLAFVLAFVASVAFVAFGFGDFRGFYGFCRYICLPIIIHYLSIYLSLSICLYLSICLSVYRSIYLSLDLSIYVSFFLPFFLFRSCSPLCFCFSFCSLCREETKQGSRQASKHELLTFGSGVLLGGAAPPQPPPRHEICTSSPPPAPATKSFSLLFC